ncbi:MAG: helix-turn-helix domain-containing protein [Bacillota bacterium]
MLSKKEACELLGVGQTTIDLMRKKGLPSYKIGQLVKFKASEIEQWIEEQSKKEQ